MFTHTRLVYLQETDATGVIYFTSLFQYALETFEAYLHEKNFSLSQVLEKGYRMPIVHAEADYKASLRVGDLVSIHLAIAHVGARSFSLCSQMENASTLQKIGSVKIVHAFIKEGETTSSAIPVELLQFLQ